MSPVAHHLIRLGQEPVGSLPYDFDLYSVASSHFYESLPSFELDTSSLLLAPSESGYVPMLFHARRFERRGRK